jgi:ankyrin repeat protein
MVEFLLELGADIHAVNERGDRAIDIAVEYCQAGIARLLLSAGSDYDFDTYHLYYACHMNNLKDWYI